MNITAHLREALTGPGAVTRLAGAALLVTTLAAQHPNPAFERAREKDLFSLVPNWKFFARNASSCARPSSYCFFSRAWSSSRSVMSSWVAIPPPPGVGWTV